MKLVLSVGSKVLDAVDVSPTLAKDTDYIEALQRLLLVKHELTILAHLTEPTFYLEIGSKLDEKCG